LPAAARNACTREGPNRAAPLSRWLDEGFAPADDRALAPALRSQNVFLLSPGGSHGPTFLVFENFLVLKAYNFADLYAVFVGHLADRIAGGDVFKSAWKTPPILSNADIETAQGLLQTAGQPIEKLDGRAGMNTRSSIGAWQAANNETVDCWPSQRLLEAVRAKVR
jgi:hypothetical protein